MSYLPADIIRIGRSYLANENMMIGLSPKSRGRNVDGLLGVKTLANFSVILDLTNYDLYLKPIDVK